MGNILFDYSKALNFIGEHEVSGIESQVLDAHDKLHNKTGQGNEFLGWVDLPENYCKDEFERIKKAAEKIKKDSDVLIVIGIGGSYLGARAAIEMLNNNFYNLLSADKRKTPQILFAGNNISSTYLKNLIELISEKDISLNVISKSQVQLLSRLLHSGFLRS